MVFLRPTEFRPYTRSWISLPPLISLWALFLCPLFCPPFFAQFLSPLFLPRFWARSFAFFFCPVLGPALLPSYLPRFWARSFASFWASFLGSLLYPPLVSFLDPLICPPFLLCSGFSVSHLLGFVFGSFLSPSLRELVFIIC